MTFSTSWRRLLSYAARVGWGRALVRTAYLLVNRLVVFRVWAVYLYTPIDLLPEVRALESPFEFRHFDGPEIEAALRDPASGIPQDQVARYLPHGSECFGFLDGQRLAHYRCYRHGPVTLRDGLTMHFPPEWVYVAFAFTSPDYRGLRLDAIAEARGLDIFSRRAMKGVVGLVDIVNWETHRSNARCGMRCVGHIVELGLRRPWIIRTTGRCADYGITAGR